MSSKQNHRTDKYQKSANYNGSSRRSIQRSCFKLRKEVNNQRQLAIDIEKKKQEIANETSAHERNNLTQDLREMEDTLRDKTRDYRWIP